MIKNDFMLKLVPSAWEFREQNDFSSLYALYNETYPEDLTTSTPLKILLFNYFHTHNYTQKLIVN